VAIAIDEALGRAGKLRLPPLAVGMGIYLPMALTLLIPVGAVIGHFYNRWAERQSNPAFADRMGILAATGLIVGESLFGVAFAGILAWANRSNPIPPNDAPLAIMGAGFEPIAMWLAPLLFFGLIAIIYGVTKRSVKNAPPLAEPPVDEDIATYR
jgi:ABC-type xylose transport system permease subunit